MRRLILMRGLPSCGKTTAARSLFPHLPYFSLETPDVREYALSDPRGFLSESADGAIFDEVQRAPDLLSYLQGIVDEQRKPGQYVLTGSQHFGLLAEVTQSLAGRTALLNLLPFDLSELRSTELPLASPFDALFHGGYPAIFDRAIPPTRFHADYVGSYIERDVRQVLNVEDLGAFQRFVRLAAGRSGQLVNLSSLGSDCGISHNTAKSWIGVLEASFVAFRVPPFHRNIGKRLVKSPKLYFWDTGLLCFLLGIREPDQLRVHPLRGAIFETWVMSELAKKLAHSGRPNDLHFYQEHARTEVDLMYAAGQRLIAAEIKSAETVSSDMYKNLDAVSDLFGADVVERYLVYGGSKRQSRSDRTVVPWSDVDTILPDATDPHP